MAFSEICRICLCVNVRMFILEKTCLRNLYKTLTNSFMDEDERLIIVCFTCHARLIRCRRLQQQAIESNAIREQMLAEGSMSIPKPHEATDEIQFTPIHHIDIIPVECVIENDCKDEILSLDSIKVEVKNFENENTEFEENCNHEMETAVKAEDLEIDAFGDRHTDSEDDLPLIAFDSKSKEKINKKDDSDIEQYNTPANYFPEPSKKKIKSYSIDSNTSEVCKEKFDFEGPTVKSNPKMKNDNQLINKKGKHPAKIMTRKILKKKSYILTKKTSGASTKDIPTKRISKSHKTQENSDNTAVWTQVEQAPVLHLMEKFHCDTCEFETFNKRNFLAHLKAHVAKQVYCCNNCDYICIAKSNLRSHMKIHTREKSFSCNICEYRCITKSNLQNHMKMHTGEKPYSCHICKYRCIKKTHLQTHMKRHTGEKPFSCNICEYRCITKYHMQSHMKRHTGEKPFSCNICEYKCISKCGLQYHIKKHTGEKPYSCHICEYRCITKSLLHRHIMKIHPGANSFSRAVW